MTVERRTTTARKRDAARTKREIITAAGRLFARSGYSQVSLQQIATEVGVTPALISHHFESKAGLFAAVASGAGAASEAPPITIAEHPADIARQMLDYWYNPDERLPSLALGHSIDVPEAVQVFRDELERQITGVWTKRLAGMPDQHERLTLITGLVMGFGYFSTGAFLDPEAPPPSPESQEIIQGYLERMISVLLVD